MATDKELAENVRNAVAALQTAAREAQDAGITCKIGVSYGKRPDEASADAPSNYLRQITCSLAKDL